MLGPAREDCFYLNALLRSFLEQDKVATILKAKRVEVVFFAKRKESRIESYFLRMAHVHDFESESL